MFYLVLKIQQVHRQFGIGRISQISCLKLPLLTRLQLIFKVFVGFEVRFIIWICVGLSGMCAGGALLICFAASR